MNLVTNSPYLEKGKRRTASWNSGCTVGYTGEGPGRIARMTPFGYVNYLLKVS